MSLQALLALFKADPGRILNDLALFFTLAGAWLLLATRRREQRATARLVAQNETQALPLDEPTLRMNRFFYRFGYACMMLALAVSWYSTQL
ncbi:hypothetical protein D9M68_629930 [compost metagenome]|uniref:Uncharacterized protein n=1 Tax=Pseudomonas jinjuensis TaxID=198616 RepID=A0A1H0QYY4_9PSED|nr:hypothetical protein [Pseudomonas jinjuensis]SDP21986.1 hypothetical protein SAMN05216193_12573 [Pseudomonas jinjuensis]